MIEKISNLVYLPFKNVGVKVVEVLPKFVGAVFLLFIGVIVGKVIKKVVEKVLVIGKLDTISEKIGISEVTYKIGLGRSPAVIIGFLVYWLIFLTFLMAAAEVLEFKIVSELLNHFILFIPRLVASIFVLAVGLIIGNFLDELISKIAYANKIEPAEKLGKIAKIVIIIFVSVIALEQLQIGTLIVSDTLRIILASVAIAAGIAFGLGGKDIAAEFLRGLFKKKE
ncbi:MAG: hypothetical protein ABII27_06315 [bacterium]